VKVSGLTGAKRGEQPLDRLETKVEFREQDGTHVFAERVEPEGVGKRCGGGLRGARFGSGGGRNIWSNFSSSSSLLRAGPTVWRKRAPGASSR